MSVEQQIRDKLQVGLQPDHLEVDNESDRHNVPPGSESHFRVTIVTEQFTDVPLIERHRRANRVLAGELAGPVHALALHTYTPQEWAGRDSAPSSPPCLGGDAP
ncbi:MAG: BolA/IbaG family iron-sulfur metabolism protein [Halofilum sp. (in: g-proteobacteria)]|nr:BolA/IbaG family iron-sulfur metabolism protein [Halofilum sp. (in: g-proteobacteria)]